MDRFIIGQEDIERILLSDCSLKPRYVVMNNAGLFTKVEFIDYVKRSFDFYVINGAWDGTYLFDTKTIYIHYTKNTIPCTLEFASYNDISWEDVEYVRSNPISESTLVPEWLVNADEEPDAWVCFAI